MKVKLLVNLKTANGSIISAGTIFNDPVPEFIMKRVARRQAEIVPGSVIPTPVSSVVESKKIKDELANKEMVDDSIKKLEVDKSKDIEDEFDNKEVNGDSEKEPEVDKKGSSISDFSKKLLTKKKAKSKK